MAAKTKSVDGQEHGASDFAYVGDAQDISTWKLPIFDKDHAQNAMARFNQTDGIPADQKQTVARKIAAKAKSFGIDTEEFEEQYCGKKEMEQDSFRKRIETIRGLKGRELRERGSVELRDGKSLTIRMFIPYDSRSVDMGFTEVIAPGAFERSIRQGRGSDRADVVALWNHDSSKPLARQANRTLEFDDSEDGLEAVATLDPSIDYHREAAGLVKSGLVRGASFGFETVRDEWTNGEDGSAVRTLQEVRLFDVSPVTYPAYPASEADVRSLLQHALRSGVDRKALIAALEQGEPRRDEAAEQHDQDAYRRLQSRERLLRVG